MYQDYYPYARVLKIDKWVSGRAKGQKPHTAILHVDAGGNSSLYNFFANGNRGCSHFFVTNTPDPNREGFVVVEQYMPVSSSDKASVDARNYGVSIETSRKCTSPENSLWTPQQQRTIIELLAWLNAEWNIPFRWAEFAGDFRGGIAGHRLGVSSSNSKQWRNAVWQYGRLQTSVIGHKWSTATGKACPTDYNLQWMYDSMLPALQKGDYSNIPSGHLLTPQTTSPVTVYTSIDGAGGKGTVRLLQSRLKEKGLYKLDIDGILSGQKGMNKPLANFVTYGSVDLTNTGGSWTVRALQVYLTSKGFKCDIDGVMGPNTVRALQGYLKAIDKHYNGIVDGELSSPRSAAVYSLQRTLLNNTF